MSAAGSCRPKIKVDFVKTLATIALALVVLVTGFLGFCFSLCAVNGGGDAGGNRLSWALFDLIDIAIMVGAFLAIVKLNRKPNS